METSHEEEENTPGHQGTQTKWRAAGTAPEPPARLPPAPPQSRQVGNADLLPFRLGSQFKNKLTTAVY